MRPAGDTAAFVRAIVFGALAAALGLAVYAAVSIASSWHIGALALAIAWCICVAMKKGSNGRGGRKYQAIAALLTYSAVSLSAIPETVAYWAREQKVDAQVPRVAERPPHRASATGEPKSAVALVADLTAIGFGSPFLALRGAHPWRAGFDLLLIALAVAYAWLTMHASPARRDSPQRS